MIVPEFNELFEPYAKSGTGLDRIRAWMLKQSKKDEVVVDQVIAETMIELANGRTFSLEGCDCGCELTNSHSAITHYMLKRVIELGNQVEAAKLDVLHKSINAAITARINVNKPTKTEKVKHWLKHG